MVKECRGRLRSHTCFLNLYCTLHSTQQRATPKKSTPAQLRRSTPAADSRQGVRQADRATIPGSGCDVIRAKSACVMWHDGIWHAHIYTVTVTAYCTLLILNFKYSSAMQKNATRRHQATSHSHLDLDNTPATLTQQKIKLLITAPGGVLHKAC